MNVVLLEPEIPPNTGNIARLCAATQTTLHLIEPLGFRLDDRQLKRAGMDYWEHLNWQRWPNWPAFAASVRSPAKLWFVESKGSTLYSAVTYGAEDYLIFGRETAGLPRQLLQDHAGQWVRIPMFHARCRSLNLSNCVALTLYEALRQQHFPNEI